MNKIIAANWKMHGNNNFVDEYFEYFTKNLKDSCNNNIIIFPSYLHLDKASLYKKNNSFKIELKVATLIIKLHRQVRFLLKC